jgi:RNA polymerase sigma factor (sigma-70 family)
MLKPRQKALSHEEIFLERYEELRSWALRLAENDHEKAEDIVQEAFIHFTLARPDLKSIANLEGYLYQVLRNLHLSQERRASRSRLQQLSVFEYDTLELALRVVGSIDRLQVQDELRRVCRYSCVRKESSRAASILILRFFHGYYPSEIALIARTNRRAVDERLRVARSEARLYLNDPTRLRFLNGHAPAESISTQSVHDPQDFLGELRSIIFGSRQNDCLTRAELEEIYKRDDGAQIPVRHLAHIVSCQVCLESVNSLLGLSSLNERHPPDMIGKDSQPKGHGGGCGRRGGHNKSFNTYRRRAREVYEHRPQELYFLVNGFILGSQKINSELSEQTLDVSLAEGVGFVEVCSEQDVRLFFMNVEPPPAGDVKQPSRVELSDGRTLELTLTFDNKWPTLHTAYRDPVMKSEALIEEPSEELKQAATQETLPDINPQESSRWNRFAAYVSGFGKPRLRLSGWLRPGMITAALALLLIASLVFVKMRAPGISAAELLQSSIAGEEKQFGNSELVFHRKLLFDERGDNGSRLIARRTIDVWHSPANELTVSRVFDEQGSLIAGEWVRPNGTSALYQHGSSPQERAAPSTVAGALIETGELWRLGLSAKDFSALVGAGMMTVREESGAYLLEYNNTQGAGSSSLVAATLTLRKGDLRAIHQRVVVDHNGERREYHFSEELFEKYPKIHVNRSVFIPDEELLSASDRNETNRLKAQDTVPAAASSLTEAAPVAASPELEIEVTYLLNRIKANLGEQVSLTRTTGGALRVEALVETEGRKEEILRALSPIINNPAVVVRVRTVNEALKAQPERQPGTTEREVVVTNNRIPAYAELMAYFSQRMVGERGVDEEISRYGNRVMTRSRQALLRASALKKLIERFSPEELSGLAPEARAKWLGMVREHALAYRREVSALRQELRPVFGGVDEGAEALNEADVRQSAERLLQLSYATDEAVRSAFTISAGGTARTDAVKSRAFWRGLATSEKLAMNIQSAYQK